MNRSAPPGIGRGAFHVEHRARRPGRYWMSVTWP
jgi:hypothetical protein